MITNEFINAVLGGQVEGFGEGDRAAVKWQYCRATMGRFEDRLWSTIEHADSGNLARLSKGFPEHVTGYLKYTKGDLAQRLKAAALLFLPKL